MLATVGYSWWLFSDNASHLWALPEMLLLFISSVSKKLEKFLNMECLKHIGLLLDGSQSCSLVDLMAVPARDLWTPSAIKNTEQKVASAPENL